MAEFVGAKSESVAPADLENDTYTSEQKIFTLGDETASAVVVSGASGNVGVAGRDGDFGFSSNGGFAGGTRRQGDLERRLVWRGHRDHRRGGGWCWRCWCVWCVGVKGGGGDGGGGGSISPSSLLSQG